MTRRGPPRPRIASNDFVHMATADDLGDEWWIKKPDSTKKSKKGKNKQVKLYNSLSVMSFEYCVNSSIFYG